MNETQNYKQLEIRKKIWIELSEFYLDTELTDVQFDQISNTFLQSGLAIDETKEIDLMEVFPLLQSNLFSFAGAWAGFDEDWLLEECTKRFYKRKNIFYRLNCKFWNFFFYWMRKDYWKHVEDRMKSN